MSRVARTVRLLVITAIVAFTPVVASAQILFADLNGDGIHDRIDAGARPTDIVVRLSAHHRQRRLHADSPIIRFAAVDFNRDGQLDLVAITRDGGRLAVWINRGGGRFSRRLTGHRTVQRFDTRGAGVSGRFRRAQPNDNGDDVASRPMALAADTRISHECSYVRRVRDTRVVHVRFQTRSLVPRGPPAPQLF